MEKPTFILLTIAVFFVTFLFGVSSWHSPDTIVPLYQTTATAFAGAPSMPPEEDSWIIVDLPPDSTQLEYGAEVYRLVCKACHGDKGQGLTDDWRAQWAPEDQNCWQSKCHGANHPSDGFYMPIGPAVVGPPLSIFDTALDLYNYIHAYMPWHDPGSMTQKDSWSVTAYILKINNVDPGSDLNLTTASGIRLRAISIADVSPVVPAPASVTQVLPVQSLQNESDKRLRPAWGVGIVVATILFILGIFTLARRVSH